MVKILSDAFGEKKGNEVKVNDMKSSGEAVAALNNFFGAR